jgi:hypothetical protein
MNGSGYAGRAPSGLRDRALIGLMGYTFVPTAICGLNSVFNSVIGVAINARRRQKISKKQLAGDFVNLLKTQLCGHVLYCPYTANQPIPSTYLKTSRTPTLTAAIRDDSLGQAPPHLSKVPLPNSSIQSTRL